MKFYIDTSVFGGYYDPEFSADTSKFFEQIFTEQVKIVYSYLIEKELEGAPTRVRELVERIPTKSLEIVALDEEAIKLATAYVHAGALTKKFEDDAIHIVLATIHRVDTLVSWNFRHMVSFFRIRQYNSVNLKLGYTTIDVRSPKELLS